MKRALAIALTLLMGVLLAAPASAKQGDEMKFQQTYSIPDDVGEVEDLGELNHGCSGGLYTLVDGTFKKKVATTFLPSEEAWNEGAEGATMTVAGLNRYSGLWDVDADQDARFELRDNNIHYEFTFGAEDPEEPESGNVHWRGMFIDSDTGEIAEWWNFHVTFDDSGETGVAEGTC